MLGKKNINKKNNTKKYIDKNLGLKIYNEEFENYILYMWKFQGAKSMAEKNYI